MSRNLCGVIKIDHLGVLRGGVSLSEEVAGCAGKIGEAGEASEGAGLFIVEQSADNGGFIFFDADGLGKRTVGNDGYAVDARAGESANLEFQLQRHFVVRMNVGRGFDLNAEIFVLRGRDRAAALSPIPHLKTGSQDSGLR